jgi:hypothetical protein
MATLGGLGERWKEALFFWQLGQQVGTCCGHGGAGEGKKEGRERQGNTGRGGGNGSVLLSVGPETDKRDTREDAQAVRSNAFQAQI